MKKLFLLLAMLAAWSAAAQPLMRGAVTTNAALQNALRGSTLYVSAAYGSDTNASPGPFATLTYAQGVATNGQTIVVTDGAFAESGLGKSGVDWVFSNGVTVSPATAVGFVFHLGTNGVSSLNVRGQATFTNSIVLFDIATNCTAFVEGKSMSTVAGAASGLAYFSAGSVSNFVEFASQTLYGWGAGSAAGVENRVRLRAALPSIVAPVYSTQGDSSLTVEFQDLIMSALPNKSAFNSSAKSVFRGGQLSRGSVAVNVLSNTWFYGTAVKTTNDFPTNLMTQGNFYFSP